MIFKNFRILIWLLIASLFFYFGVLFESREKLSSSPNNVNIVAENGYVENSISNLEKTLIYGFDRDGSVKTFGYFLYKQNYLSNDTKNLEVVILLQRLPKEFAVKDGPAVKYPNKLSLGYATLCCNNEDLEIKTLSQGNNPITFKVQREEREGAVDISTILDLDLINQKVQAFFLYDTADNNAPIMSPYVIREDPKKNWPAKFTQKNFPILWVYIV